MKKKNTGTIGMSEWKALLSKNITERSEVVPPGWKTIPEVAQEINLSVITARAKLNQWVKAGAIERRQFRVAGNYNSAKIWHYRMPEKTKDSLLGKG